MPPATTGRDGRVTGRLTLLDMPFRRTRRAPAEDQWHAGCAASGHHLHADSDGQGRRQGDADVHPCDRAGEVTNAAARWREGGAVVFPVTRSLTLTWTADVPRSDTPGEDYHVEVVGRMTLTVDDRQVESVEPFTVTVTLPVGAFAEMAASWVGPAKANSTHSLPLRQAQRLGRGEGGGLSSAWEPC